MPLSSENTRLDERTERKLTEVRKTSVYNASRHLESAFRPFPCKMDRQTVEEENDQGGAFLLLWSFIEIYAGETNISSPHPSSENPN